MSGGDTGRRGSWTPEDLRRLFAPLNGPRSGKDKDGDTAPPPEGQAPPPDEDGDGKTR